VRTHASKYAVWWVKITADRLVELAGLLYGFQQRQRIDANPAGQPLDRPQSDIALAALKTAEVGPVHTKGFRKALLGQAARLADASEVGAQAALQVSLHHSDVRGTLLIGLQTDE
jgi:hypothetical protein